MNPEEPKQNYWETPEPTQPVQPSQPAPQPQFQQQPQQPQAQPQTLQQPVQQPEVFEEEQGPIYEQVEQEPQVLDTPVSWTAQEYVHLDKSPMWFVLFVLVVLAFIAFDLFFLKSYTFSALVVVMAIAVVIYIRRPPRQLTYGLSAQQGLYVGDRLYHFEEFKSFGVIKDGDHHSIMLIPTKRFAPGVSVYFPEEAGEQIVDILGQRLPMEDLKLDVIDIVVRKLRL